MKEILETLGLIVGIVLISYCLAVTEKTNTSFVLLPEANAQQLPDLDPPKLIPYRKGDMWGFSDANKKLIVQARYEEANLLTDGLARVKLNGKYGFIDESGNEVIALKYDNAYVFFRDELVAVWY